MRRFWLLIAAIAMPVTAIGCGTFSDTLCGPVQHDNEPKYYRGVRMDLDAVKQGGWWMLMAADLPLSAVADTLLIPHHAAIAKERRISSKLQESEEMDHPPGVSNMP